jgi:hypothetical protein
MKKQLITTFIATTIIMVSILVLQIIYYSPL